MANQLQPGEIFKWVLYGAGAIAIYKIGGKFGIWKTAADTAADAAEKANYWDYTKIFSIYLLMIVHIFFLNNLIVFYH